jgi:hypothetical protein
VKVSWKTLYSRLASHENCVLRCTCYCKWKELQQSLKNRGTDSDLQKHTVCEAENEKSILKRLLGEPWFLSSTGLLFQGESTTTMNNGKLSTHFITP